MKRILTFLCIAVSSYTIFAQQSIRHTVNFSPYVIDSLYVDENTYNTINIDSCDSYSEVGKPVLPVKYIHLLIPKRTRATGIVINKTSRLQTQTLLHKVSYGTPPVPAGETIEQDTIGFDTILYSQSTPYPLSRVSIIRKDYFRGNCIVTVAIYPILYAPSINQISYVSSIDFSLQYVTDTSLKKDMYFDYKDRGLLSHMIDNQNNIITFAPLNISPNSNGTKNISVNSKYLIVTERNLIPAFAEFMDWKRRKGITIQAVAIEDVLADYTQGDIVSGINDDAGNLRQFLNDAYQQGVEYVLLAGTNIPIRKGCSVNNSYSIADNIPTDLYFSDFDGNWNVDMDNIYGEPSDDNIDLSTEIFIGRIMARNEWEVRNWVRKVIYYEQNPGNGDGSYLTKFFVIQSDFMQHYSEAQTFWYPNINWITYTLLFEEQGGYNTPYLPEFPKGADVISELNNHYGIAGILGHGGPNAISTSSICDNGQMCEPNVQYLPPHVISSSDQLQIYTIEDGNGLDNMTNYCFPTITYSTACTTMPFDNYQNYNDNRNLGDAYTCVIKGGGPAYLGNTRDGFSCTGGEGSSDLAGHFLNIASQNISFNLGIMESLAREFSPLQLLRFSHNLMGCPETELWTAQPNHFEQVSIQENGNSLLVNAGIDNVSICVMSAIDNGASFYQIVSDVSSYNFQNISKPYKVTITKHNYFPYLSNPNSIYIQNVQWNNERVISANNFFIGTDVTNDISYGNVIINSPANIILKADGDVYIKSEFEVTSGASFEIKTNNSNENTCL